LIDAGLARELAQAGARATLNELDRDSGVRWSYRADTVVRNLTAVGQTLLLRGDVGPSRPVGDGAALAVAQGWEHLAALGESVDRSTALLNSAVFYEVAGYQANAACLARQATSSRRWTSDPSFDGLVSAFLQRLFLRVQLVSSSLSKPPELIESEAELQRRASQAVAALGLHDACRFFLAGDESALEDAQQRLELAKRGFADVGDAVGYNAAAGLAAVLPLMAERSTWRQLRNVNPSARWQRYIRILARGLGSDILDARSISELWPSQRSALEAGLLGSTASLAIRMPTSAGKTRVAELAIVDSLVNHPGSKCIYIAPFRALANEVDQAFSNLFLDLGYGASTIPGGFDQDEMSQELASIDDVLVLTPEKLDLLFRLRGDFLDQVSLIVIDEGHIVADQSRGPKFELLVSRLRRRLPTARFLMMSAVVPDETLQDFAIWLGGSPDRFASTAWRPSILRFGRLDWDGATGTLRFAANEVADGGLEFVPNLISQSTFDHVAEETGRRRSPKFPRPGNKGEVAAEVAYRYAPLGPVLIFSMQTNWAESIASAMLRRIELAELTDEEVPKQFVLRREGRALAVATEWMGEAHPVTEYLRRGIAFHHGRLPDAVRDAIEEDFRARRLAVLVATSTLAQGVNLPVRTVVMHSVRSRDADGSARVLSSREYWNIAGRAGRAGAETEGTVIHIASTGYDVEDFNRYAIDRNDVERVESALHRMLRDLVADRISSDDAARQLDSDLLALLVEEAEGALDAEVLSQTLASSLFAVQALESETPTEPLITVMTSTAQRIGRDIPDVDTRRLYASTGLSSGSCLAIARHIEGSGAAPVLYALIEEGGIDDRDDLLDMVLAGLAEVEEMETRAELPVDTRELLSAWIDGTPVHVMADRFELGDPQEVTEYIEDAFSYRLPWGVSGYLRIATSVLATTVTSPLASNLAGMIKYGVPSPEAVWAMTAGVASRRAAIAVADAYLRGDPDRRPSDFRRWLARLDPDSVAEQLGFSGGELEATARAILRSQPNEFLARLDTDAGLYPLRASIRPVRTAINSGLIYELSPGDHLTVRRDRDSRLNRNAVLLLVNRVRLGYLQADAARAVALDLDSGAEARAEVVSVLDSNGPAEVEILIDIQVDPDTSGARRV
jgi:superfamily II DNA/RNA helicase